MTENVMPKCLLGFVTTFYVFCPVPDRVDVLSVLGVTPPSSFSRSTFLRSQSKAAHRGSIIVFVSDGYLLTAIIAQ